jgi:D-3-phosphoglycerate dehydrogenase
MPRFLVQTLNDIAPAGLARFPAGRYEIGRSIADPDAILVRSHDLHRTPIPDSVKAIGRAGAGTNNIPVAALSERGVPVFNTPGANAHAVCELVVAGLLIAARRIVPAVRFVEELRAEASDYGARVEAGKRPFAGVEIANRTLGIIGVGAIGARVAEWAHKLGMSVIGYDPHWPTVHVPSGLAHVARVDTLEALLGRVEFATVHVPLGPETRHLIDARRLALLRPGATLLNFSREEIVDALAVVEAVRRGQLGAYVCDFPHPAFRGEPRIVALPHLGASTVEAEENCATMVVEQVRAFLEDGTIENSVNFPSVEMPRELPYRVAIANANVPNMLGQISSAVARAGCNIHDMVNKSRGEVAYTLVDLDSPVEADLVATLAGILGVLSVRTIPPPE